MEKDAQVLFYIGVNHTHNPSDSQFKQIENFWTEFINKTNGKNCIALTEGGKRPSLKTKELAIQTGGEAHFLAYLAQQKHIPTKTPEPRDQYRFDKLLKSFTKDQIEYYFFAMIIPQWHRLNPKPDFTEYIQKYLNNDKEVSKWQNYDFSLQHMIKIHQQIFGIEFNPNDKKFFYNIVNPTITTTITNLVSRANTQIRDEYIVKNIVKYWEENKNIFLVFGSSHVVMQEPALKALINS